MKHGSTNETSEDAGPARRRAAAAAVAQSPTPRSAAEEALVDVVLAALADPTRRRILSGLSTAGASTATLLARDLPVTRQAVVKHLAVLHEAGLVVGRKTGREVRYSVDAAPLAATARWMGELVSEWDRPREAAESIAEPSG